MTDITLDNSALANIGYVDDKGWRYEGISETTGTRLWSAEKHSEIMTWDNALEFTQELRNFQGYDGSKQYTAELLEDASIDDGGVRLPTREELSQMFENNKNMHNKDNADLWCWSSSSNDDNHAWVQNALWLPDDYRKNGECSVRCVRSEPRPKS